MQHGVMFTLSACAMIVAGAAAAQEAGKADTAPPPVTTGGKPAADTQTPGKTATDAVTNPAQVPPSKGGAGTDAQPGPNSTNGGSAAQPAPAR